MSGSVHLSIILTTHTEKIHFESLLITLTRINHPGIELIIINDTAESHVAESIQQALSACKNEQVYYFEHDHKTGRGNCLNEGLNQASGMLIWAPLKAQRLNESLLVEAIRKFRTDPAAFWSLDYSLPKDPFAWIEAAKEGDLPDDSCLVWNRQVIDSKQFFFNPFLNRLHGAELALRLLENNAWHKTDPFFVLSDNQSPIAGQQDITEFYYTLLRLNLPADIKRSILNNLIQNPSESDQKSDEDRQLIKARQFLNQGDANKSLDLISKFLKKNPEHHEANRIKIISLEKLRRHVEAAELKHHLQKQDALPKEQAELFSDERRLIEESKSRKIELSVVIPTTGLGKSTLENTLTYLVDAVDDSTTELIIVDNASIDDTFDYLNQLKEKKFLNLKVITNEINRGFGASINQGIDLAKGSYVLVMHNDLYLNENTVTLLQKAFEDHSNLGLSVPVLNETDIPEQQKTEQDTAEYLPTKTIDSACFLVPADIGIKFDEEFHLCHFETHDYCRQLEEQGRPIVTVTAAGATHDSAKTLSMMGISLVPKLKWANRDRYHKKWAEPSQYHIPNQGTHPERFIKLGVPDDPFSPDPEWVNAVQNYLTDEVKTEILRTDWDEEDLSCIVTSLLIADERELLRTLEDRLDFVELPPALLLLFVEYYHNKNIYSRCRHYLEKAGNSHPAFDLYRLKILVADKEIDTAAPLLTKMLDKYPASPDLLHLAGDLYRTSGEEGEAKSFYALAAQLDPFRFSTADVVFEINS